MIYTSSKEGLFKCFILLFSTIFNLFGQDLVGVLRDKTFASEGNLLPAFMLHLKGTDYSVCTD